MFLFRGHWVRGEKGQQVSTKNVVRDRGIGPRFYSVAEVAEIFRMSSMTVYRAIAAGEFPAVRIRGRWIVPARAVEELIDAAMSDRDAGAQLLGEQARADEG